jgi:hypothetical protein
VGFLMIFSWLPVHLFACRQICQLAIPNDIERYLYLRHRGWDGRHNCCVCVRQPQFIRLYL